MLHQVEIAPLDGVDNFRSSGAQSRRHTMCTSRWYGRSHVASFLLKGAAAVKGDDVQQPTLSQPEAGTSQRDHADSDGAIPPAPRCVSGRATPMRLARALLLGIPAAVVGRMIYSAVGAFGGDEAGVLPIVIGFLIGGAVRLSRS